jgi:hypothetical protein
MPVGASSVRDERVLPVEVSDQMSAQGERKRLPQNQTSSRLSLQNSRNDDGARFGSPAACFTNRQQNWCQNTNSAWVFSAYQNSTFLFFFFLIFT